MLSLPNVIVLYILPLVKQGKETMQGSVSKRGKNEQHELEGERKTPERKWRIILHVRSNTDPTRAGAEVRRAVKQEELEEAAPIKAP